MSNIFKDGGGAGIGSYVVVFKDGQLAENTDLAKVRGAYESGDSIFISIIDEGTEDALVPASGWIDEEAKLHLVARDFDDNKTYSLELGSDPTEPIEAKVEDGIEAGGEPLGGTVKVEDGKLLVSEVVQPVGPVPVTVIDGVKYYHKSEFNINEAWEEVIDYNKDYDFRLVDFVLVENPQELCHLGFRKTLDEHKLIGIYWGLSQAYPSPNDYSHIIKLDSLVDGYALPDTLYQVGGNVEIDVFNSVEPVCSAIYLKYDEATSILTCYYNLKGEGQAEVAPVTKIKDASNHEVEIHDARIPEASTEDVGKVLGVNEQNALAFIEATGGEKIYDGSSVSTVADLLALIGIDMTPEEVNAGGFYRISGLYNAGILVPFADKIFIVAGKRPGRQLDVELMYYGLQPAGLTLYIYSDLNATLGSVQPLTQQLVPIVPQDTSKVYVLQCINGALTWIEEPDAVEIG